MKIKGIEKIGKLPESGFTGLEDVQDNRLRGYERKGGLRQVAPGSSSTNPMYFSGAFSKRGSRREQINQFFVNERLSKFPLNLRTISHDRINFFSIETD